MTIKELASRCDVSEQAIRAWCRKNGVPKDAKGKGFAINETTEMAILLHYGAIEAKDAKTKERNLESSSETRYMLEILQKELDFCKSQLEAKDVQIATLQKSLESTTEALKDSQESLKASQLLQANAEKKVLQLEEKEEPARHWWNLRRK